MFLHGTNSDGFERFTKSWWGSTHVWLFIGITSGNTIGARVFTNKGTIKVVQASLRATSITESGKLESTRFRKEVSNWQREDTFCPWPDNMPAAICWHNFLTQMREDTPQNKPTDDNPIVTRNTYHCVTPLHPHRTSSATAKTLVVSSAVFLLQSYISLVFMWFLNYDWIISDPVHDLFVFCFDFESVHLVQCLWCLQTPVPFACPTPFSSCPLCESHLSCWLVNLGGRARCKSDVGHNVSVKSGRTWNCAGCFSKHNREFDPNSKLSSRFSITCPFVHSASVFGDGW